LCFHPYFATGMESLKEIHVSHYQTRRCNLTTHKIGTLMKYGGEEASFQLMCGHLQRKDASPYIQTLFSHVRPHWNGLSLQDCFSVSAPAYPQHPCMTCISTPPVFQFSIRWWPCDPSACISRSLDDTGSIRCCGGVENVLRTVRGRTTTTRMGRTVVYADEAPTLG
jgi:hypothetical protein